MTDVIAAQQAALLALYRSHVGTGHRYALVDFPDHANVGDSAIWLGEIAMLKSVTGRDPDYVSTWQDFDAAVFADAAPEGVLFLHGGGNLGDIWPHHQRFREMLLATVRDRRVVQLPQSIHFRDAGGIARFASLVADHADFHLHVRDRTSLDLARRELRCLVGLAPDSAFALGAQPRAPADHDVLMLMRTDDERVAADHCELLALPDSLACDWLDDDALPPAVVGETRAAWYRRMATARVDRGLALLSRGRRIVTDRLHAHILATLLDIPHVALDNDYGKIAAYAAVWTQGSPCLHLAESSGEAVAALAAMDGPRG